MTLRRRLGGQGMSPLDLGSALSSRPTSLGEMATASFEQGWADSPILGGTVPPLLNTETRVGTFVEERLDELRSLHPGQEFTDADLATLREQFRQQGQRQLQEYTPLPAARWQESPHFREGVPYEDGMTVERAEALAERYDESQYRQWLIDNHEGIGFGISTVTGFMAGVAGGALDPTNYIPVAGPVMRAAAIARLGRIGGRAAVGMLEGATGSAIVLPFVNESRRLIGQEMSTADMVLDVIMGAVAGAAFGGVAGVSAVRQEARAASMLTDLRVADEGLAKTRLAMSQIAGGERVDVPEVSRASRDALLQGMSVEDRVRYLTAERDTALTQAGTVLERMIAEDGGAPVQRGPQATLTIAEVNAIRSPSQAQRDAAREALDTERQARVEARRAADPNRLGQDTVRALEDIERPAVVAQERAEADALVATLREAGVARDGETRQVTKLTPLERMALADPSPRVRALARAEIDRRLTDSANVATPPHQRPSSIPPAGKAPKVAAPADPAAVRTPTTGDASADIDAKAEIQAMATEHGFDESGDFAEMREWERMEAAGQITPADRAAFEAAEEAMAKTAKADEVYAEATACLLKAA